MLERETAKARSKEVQFIENFRLILIKVFSLIRRSDFQKYPSRDHPLQGTSPEPSPFTSFEKFRKIESYPSRDPGILYPSRAPSINTPAFGSDFRVDLPTSSRSVVGARGSRVGPGTASRGSSPGRSSQASGRPAEFQATIARKWPSFPDFWLSLPETVCTLAGTGQGRVKDRSRT